MDANIVPEIPLSKKRGRPAKAFNELKEDSQKRQDLNYLKTKFNIFRAKKELKQKVLENLISEGLNEDLVSETFSSGPKVTHDVSQLLKNITKMFEAIPSNSPFRTTLHRELFQGNIYFYFCFIIILNV